MSKARTSWSWAESPDEASAYQAEARKLVGQIIARVRYSNIDYLADQYRHGVAGPRSIESEAEWNAATWRHPACDTVDFAVELETRSRRYFTVSWDSPGAVEGIGLRELGALGNAFAEDEPVALWDVTERSGWSELAGKPVTDVVLHYEPWGEISGARWCSWITVRIDGTSVQFLLAEGQADSPDAPTPSVDNVAVVFDSGALPL